MFWNLFLRRFNLGGICCGAQWINYATIANYLERELRYMDAGERGSSASLGQ
jgi:hypothetical protein